MNEAAGDACDGRFKAMSSVTLSRLSWNLCLPRNRSLSLGGIPRVMGVVNITPDSFSDGGRYLEPDRAVDHGLTLLEEGADLLDLGAESTRPGGGVYGGGAARVPVAEELDRLLPVLERLRDATDAPISVDTRKGAVARRALAAGADLINDISNLADPELGEAVAEAQCPLVLMHSRGDLSTMQRNIRFDDPVAEVLEELEGAAARAQALGVRRDQLVFDPGLGFGKTWQQSLELLSRMDVFADSGRPLLIGASRKSFIGQVTGAGPEDRLAGSLATVGWAAFRGAAMVRVHDVEATVRFLEMWRSLEEAGTADAGTAAESPADGVVEEAAGKMGGIRA